MLLGDVALSDNIVAACLESILQQSPPYFETDDIAAELFRMYLKKAVEEASHVTSQSVLEQYIPDLGFSEKQAFLLRYVEEFDRASTARIMDLTAADIGQLERSVERKVKTSD